MNVLLVREVDTEGVILVDLSDEITPALWMDTLLALEKQWNLLHGLEFEEIAAIDPGLVPVLQRGFVALVRYYFPKLQESCVVEFVYD